MSTKFFPNMKRNDIQGGNKTIIAVLWEVSLNLHSEGLIKLTARYNRLMKVQ